MSDSIYGFDTSDEVKLDSSGLPVGTYKVMIVGEEVGETKKECNPRPLILKYEILEGKHKGKSANVYYNVNYIDEKGTAAIAQGNLKRIADATGKAISNDAPAKGRVLTVEVAQQKKNPDYTEIKRYYPENFKVNDPF
jgi:hypothetical protein